MTRVGSTAKKTRILNNNSTSNFLHHLPYPMIFYRDLLHTTLSENITIRLYKCIQYFNKNRPDLRLTDPSNSHQQCPREQGYQARATIYLCIQVLLEQSHPHLFTYHLWLLLFYTLRDEQLQQRLYGQQPKILTHWPCTERAEPCPGASSTKSYERIRLDLRQPLYIMNFLCFQTAPSIW